MSYQEPFTDLPNFFIGTLGRTKQIFLAWFKNSKLSELTIKWVYWQSQVPKLVHYNYKVEIFPTLLFSFLLILYLFLKLIRFAKCLKLAKSLPWSNNLPSWIYNLMHLETSRKKRKKIRKFLISWFENHKLYRGRRKYLWILWHFLDIRR